MIGQNEQHNTQSNTGGELRHSGSVSIHLTHDLSISKMDVRCMSNHRTLKNIPILFFSVAFSMVELKDLYMIHFRQK